MGTDRGSYVGVTTCGIRQREWRFQHADCNPKPISETIVSRSALDERCFQLLLWVDPMVTSHEVSAGHRPVVLLRFWVLSAYPQVWEGLKDTL